MSDHRSPSADRNLLFGILALQMDFISRDALIQAMNAWVLEKHRPLGDILAGTGQLGEAERDLLEALVEKHLERHRDDPRESLAAMASRPAIERDLAHISDGEVQASLSSLFSAPETMLEGTTALEAERRPGPRFRRLRPHARGGLGEVFVALDQELNREVALKEIQEHHAHDMHSRGRFVLEAEITGGLEHPGVVPVYGLGQYADGRPYYAMRLIKGESLQAAIARFHEGTQKELATDARRSQEFELRLLLTRFVAVCNTIAYAHSRGVLHRDLKPANIMLGKYGETLVIDWGLAKAIDRPETASTVEEASLRPSSGSGLAPTEAGTVVGTPAFMSPEQAAGKWDQVGPASDVYSLGATLYMILTGQPPFRGSDMGAILNRVESGNWLPPRKVNPQTPLGLDAICRKAMALSPADRYPSALDLAADMEHWLADEPVSACPEPRSVRLGRWLRRHRVAAVGTAAALLAAVLCLGASTGFLLAANREAERQRHNAATERDRAAERFRLAQAAVDQFHTKVSQSDDLNAHGLEGLRKKLLQLAADFYEKLVREEGDDVSVRAEQGRAHRRLAILSAELGDLDRAFRNDRAAQAIFEQLQSEHPEIVDYGFELAVAHSNLGLSFRAQGKNP